MYKEKISEILCDFIRYCIQSKTLLRSTAFSCIRNQFDLRPARCCGIAFIAELHLL
ncbi:hypothetical protein PUN28_006767 [Cardiocondyla obscurior]|uniref:Uncharacterized protein n=1 Tax=Cardiocondyla obscurior TaxID=286306 RepID=A0AAW2G4M7_9HYME